MIDLKAIAGERWKITLDESATDDTSREDRLWFYRISGKRGHIYVHGTDRLGVWTDNRGMRDRIASLPGTVSHQRGDREWTFTIPIDHLDTVAEIIHARRRPRLSDEQRENLRQRMILLREQPSEKRPTFDA